MKGDKITDWMNGLVNDKSIEQFEIPYAAIATDMQAEKPVMITSGNTGFAIRASAAIPGIMAAVPYGSSELVDGGMTSMVPVRAAKKLGADVVIGVDIYCNSERYAGSDIPTVVLRVSQMQSCLISQLNEVTHCVFWINYRTVCADEISMSKTAIAGAIREPNFCRAKNGNQTEFRSVDHWDIR